MINMIVNLIFDTIESLVNIIDSSLSLLFDAIGNLIYFHHA
jgi:hypothetical protein